MAKFAPDKTETYVEKHLAKMYCGTAPTMREVRDLHGDNAINEWLGGQILYMFELTDASLDPVKVNSMIRLIRSSYQWLKVTEFMHFVHLFRLGEYGKVYGKADGQTVMLAIKDFCRRRDETVAAISREMERELRAAETKPIASSAGSAIAEMISSPEFARYGEWRKEPWAGVLARAFFVDHRLSVFPGEMSAEDREMSAIAAGYVPDCAETA